PCGRRPRDDLPALPDLKAMGERGPELPLVPAAAPAAAGLAANAPGESQPQDDAGADDDGDAALDGSGSDADGPAPADMAAGESADEDTSHSPEAAPAEGPVTQAPDDTDGRSNTHD